MSQSKRIEFIDLAKGICIILVVMGHCGCPINIPGYEIVRMPLYFILSGLFFKDYGGFINLLVKKANKLLVPFIFFYLLGCVCYYALKWFAPSLLVTSAEGILDVFNNRQFFNGPIWFLLCLFWCNLIFCLLSLYVRSDLWRVASTCIIGAVGWYLGHIDIFLPLYFDVALTALPFFVFGYYLKRTNLLYPNGLDRYNLLFALLLWGIAYLITLFADQRLSLHFNKIVGWTTYVVAILSVMSILFLCKAVKRLPFVSYVGRYSIVLLCVHHMIYRPVSVLLTHIGITPPILSTCVAIITLFLSACCIPLFKRFLPWTVAQRDLIFRHSHKSPA